MRFFGLEIRRAKAAPSVATTVSNRWGWLGTALESFSGAWQRGITVDSRETLLAFSAVYACIALIADDISKLRIKLMQATPGGLWIEKDSPAFSPVLKKPNNYQTRIQFLSAWITSKLLDGNTYVLKERDARKVVVALHVLDPRRVLIMVTQYGDVYYQLQQDHLTGLADPITVPASEIIHDRAVCLFHPLIGVGPIFACGIAATQGNRIQANSTKFFENMSRPSGMLTAPEEIDDATAARLKRDFEAGFSGVNLGRLLVAGSGLKYEPMTIPAQQAQLIEQLKWTVEDVARCFKVPLHKIGAATNVKFSNMAEMNQDYYSQTLQALIESVELLLDEGLGLAGDGRDEKYGTELDLEGLLRMDPVQRAERNQIAISAGYMAPNEARATDGMLPVKGGEEPYLQQQNYPLSVLVQQPPPGSTPPPAATAPEPAPADGSSSKEIVAMIERLAGQIAAANAAPRPDVDAVVERMAAELRAELAEMRKSASGDDDQADVEDLANALILRFATAGDDVA